MWKLRYLIGGLCLCAAFVFLSINSMILSRGAFRWAASPVDQWAYAVVAGFVPWLIAVMPFVVAAAFLMKRPGWGVAAGFVYVLFIAYNVLGATGTTALIRGDVLAERQHGVTTEANRSARRLALQARRDAISKSTRPAAQVKGLMEAEHAKRTWQDTDGCKDTSNNRERKFCAAYAQLQAEQGAAADLAAIDSQIAAIDTAMESGGPVAATVDPDAVSIASITGFDERLIAKWLPLRTPIVLEIGAMFLLGFALVAFELDHRAMLIGQRSTPPHVAQSGKPGGGDSLPARSPSPATTTLTQQRALAEYFFSQCARPAASGAMPESQWYAHYEQVCKAANDIALPLEGFRRIARGYISDMVEIDGRVTYRGWLPLIPKGAAA